MQTATGNLVRRSLAFIGRKVSDYASAVAAVGFTIISEPAARLSTGRAIPNTQNLYRSDNGTCLGQHTPQYTFLQPTEQLSILEQARQLIGGQWASVAVNKGGRQLAAFIDIETKIVAPKRGDRISLSVGQFDRYDGGGKDKFQLFANVLACTNGMTRAESLFYFAEKHNGTLTARIEAMKLNLFVALQNQIEEMQGIVTQLDTREMDRSEIEGFARTLFPATDETAVPTRTQNKRDAIVTGFFRGTGNRGQTRWDAFNSVTEYLDWNSTFRNTEYSADENRFESLTTGNGAQLRSRALELLLN